MIEIPKQPVIQIETDTCVGPVYVEPLGLHTLRVYGGHLSARFSAIMRRSPESGTWAVDCIWGHTGNRNYGPLSNAQQRRFREAMLKPVGRWASSPEALDALKQGDIIRRHERLRHSQHEIERLQAAVVEAQEKLDKALAEQAEDKEILGVTDEHTESAASAA